MPLQLFLLFGLLLSAVCAALLPGNAYLPPAVPHFGAAAAAAVPHVEQLEEYALDLPLELY